MNVYRNVEVLPVKCCVFLLFSRPFVFLCVFCVCVVGRGLQFPSLIISPPTPHQPVNLSCIKPRLNLADPAGSFSLPSGNSAAAYPVFFYELCSSEIFNCGKGKTPSATLILSPALFVSTSTLRDSCHHQPRTTPDSHRRTSSTQTFFELIALLLHYTWTMSQDHDSGYLCL